MGNQKIPISAVSGAGTAAAKNTGTALGNVVELVDNSGTPALPAVDGSQLTGLPSDGSVDQAADYVWTGDHNFQGSVSGSSGTVSQRNGSNAQTFRIYGTYTSGSGTDASNDIAGEWLSVGYNGTEFEIGAKAGTAGGSARDLLLQVNDPNSGDGQGKRLYLTDQTWWVYGRFGRLTFSSSGNGFAFNSPVRFENKIQLSNIPNSDPSSNGQLWNDNGTLKISAG